MNRSYRWGSPLECSVSELLQSDFQSEDRTVISRQHRAKHLQKGTPRKELQLCRQVGEILNGVLSGECRDPLLQSLYVETVVPAKDASQLLIYVRSLDRDSAACDSEILDRLSRVCGWLRREVAAAISRRRVPSLIFQVCHSAAIHQALIQALPPNVPDDADAGGGSSWNE